MSRQVICAIRLAFLQALAGGVLIGALVSPVRAQNYMYGQTGVQTGANPTGLAVADFNGDGRLDLATANQASNTASVILTKTDGTFAAKTDYPVGNTPVQLVAADFNRDGIVDLAVANRVDNTVSLLSGVGDGTFKSETIIPVGNGPMTIAAGDFDGDGNADLAVGNQSDSTISILLGNGQGGFARQTPISVNGEPHFLLAGDVNHDGRADLFAVATDPNSGDTVFLLTSGGKGAFSVTPVSLGFPGSASGSSIANLALGDFNNDGNLDVAFSITPLLVNGDFNAYVLMGNGAGAFKSVSTSLTGSLSPPPASVAAADYNRDGNLDLVVVEAFSVAVYLGKGDGTFKSPLVGGVLTGGIANGPQQLVVAADFNNDATPDLAVLSPGNSVAAILLGNGDGTLSSRYDVSLPTSAATAAAVLDDFNNDGKPDLATAQFSQAFPSGIISGFVTSLLGSGDGTFQTPVSTVTGDIGIVQLISGDFLGNGKKDLVSSGVNNNGGFAIFPGAGNGSFGLPIECFMLGSADPLNPYPMVVGDLNNDGKMDLVGASSGYPNNLLYVFLNQGDGTFTAKFLYDVPYGFTDAVVATDFNHDGYLDLAATTENSVSVFLGRGDGSFQTPVTYAIGYPADALAAGDFNGDGKIDMLVGAYYSNSLFFFAGNGDGTFQPMASTPPSTNFNYVLVADFNGDGLLDLADGTLDFIFLGNGDGTFHDGGVPLEGTFRTATIYDGAFTDINGDGTVDLVQVGQAPGLQLGSTAPQTATVWLSTPTLSFTASSLQFGEQNVGASSSSKTIQVANAGNAALSLTRVAVSGDFRQTNTCGSTVQIKKACSVQVTFTPTANGLRSGSLTFNDSGRPGTQSLPLTGWAGPPDFVPSVSPGSVTVKAGSSAEYFVVVRSGDGFAGTVQMSCSGAPSKASCTLSSQSVQVVANGTARVQVIVSTTAASSAAFFPDMTIHTPDKPAALAFGIALVCIWGGLAARRRRARLLPSFGLCLVLVGCGGGGHGLTGPPPVSGTPGGNYVITVTMTSGNSVHSLTPTLVVQ
jgi:FG-GAP-like repeat/Abnormal spindle-like microcephaly-assoc'd, ASPM-SPD-2-Hydin/FG-GAP repeat